MLFEQTKLIQLYRKKFPHESFRKMSKKTGIQISRLFRVFNGHEMRLSEFLTLQESVCDEAQFVPTVNADEQMWHWFKEHWSALSLSRKHHVQELVCHYLDEMQDYYPSQNNVELHQQEDYSHEA